MCGSNIGADPDIADYGSVTPLSMASHTGRHECVSLLLKAGASVDLPDIMGKAPLFTACNVGQLKCALLLIEHGADMEKEDKAGNNILMSFVVTGKPHVLSFILVHGGSKLINAQNKQGQNAVECAHQCGYTKCVELLIEHGTDASKTPHSLHATNDNTLAEKN